MFSPETKYKFGQIVPKPRNKHALKQVIFHKFLYCYANGKLDCYTKQIASRKQQMLFKQQNLMLNKTDQTNL